MKQIMISPYGRTSIPSHSSISQQASEIVNSEGHRNTLSLSQEIKDYKEAATPRHISNGGQEFSLIEKLMQLSDHINNKNEDSASNEHENKDFPQINNTSPAEVRFYYNNQQGLKQKICPEILDAPQRQDIKSVKTNTEENEEKNGVSEITENGQDQDKKNSESDLTKGKSSFDFEVSKSEITSIQTEKESYKGLEDEISEIGFKIPSFSYFSQDLQSERISDPQDSAADEEYEDKMCEKLSIEIWEHNIKCMESYQKAWEDIEPLFCFLCQIGHEMGMLVEVVGSFSTSLWTPLSDINIFFIPNYEGNFQIKKLLSQIYNCIKREKESLKYHCLFLNDKPKDQPFLNIKGEFGEEKRRVSLGITTKRNTARAYSKYVSDCVKSNPFIRPIFFTFYKLLENFGLHRPNKRGLKNYAIFLMIMKSFEAYPSNNLSQSFINFIYFFAEVYEFQEEVVEENGHSVEKEKLSLIDPLNPSIKFGGNNTNISRLTHLFGAVNCALKMGYRNNILDYLWSLHLMFEEAQEGQDTD